MNWAVRVHSSREQRPGTMGYATQIFHVTLFVIIALVASTTCYSLDHQESGDGEMFRPRRSERPGYYLASEDSLMKRPQRFSFGLGKRLLDEYTDDIGDELMESDLDEIKSAAGSVNRLSKRDPYAFGLGKRDPYAFGLGKREPYAFGLGKREPYAFGLGKRSSQPQSQYYGFGLGKREPYAFGLGK